MSGGHKSRLGVFVSDNGRFVRRLLAMLGVPERDVPDVEQEVLSEVARELTSFEPSIHSPSEGAPQSWLRGLCERAAAVHHRTRRRRKEVLCPIPVLDTRESPAPDAEERLARAEYGALLVQLLESIDPQRRAVVIAHEVEGAPMADVAAALSISINTAWNRLRLGREDLRAAWRRKAKGR